MFHSKLLLASTLKSSCEGKLLHRMIISNSSKLILNTLVLDLSLANSLIKLPLSLLLCLENFFSIDNPLRNFNLDLGTIDIE